MDDCVMLYWDADQLDSWGLDDQLAMAVDKHCCCSETSFIKINNTNPALVVYH